MTNDLAAFLTNIRELGAPYRALDVRAVGTFDRSGAKQLRGLRVNLTGDDPATSPSLLGPTGPWFWSCHVVLPVVQLTAILNDLAEGRLRVNGTEAVVLEREGRPPTLASFFHEKRPGEKVETGFHHAGIGTTSAGGLPWRDENTLLRALDSPWDGWADVSENFLGLLRSGPFLHDHSAAGLAIAIEAPLGLHLVTATASERDCELRILAWPTINPKQVAIRLIASGPWGTDRIAVSLNDLDPTGVVRIPLREGTWQVVACASYAGWPAGWIVAVPPNRHRGERRAVLDALAGKRDAVREGITDAANRGRGLEPWLALALHNLGVSVARTDALRNETVDMVAELPGQRVLLAIECTEGSPDKREKMRKLLVRSRELEDRLSREVLPILVTRMSAKQVPETDRQTAGREGIVLLCMEDLDVLFDTSGPNLEPNDLVEFLSSRIPALPDGSQPGRRSELAYL